MTASLVDQGAYSLQNFAVAFTALHQLGLGELGAFSLASTMVIFAQVSLRAGVLEPLTIRASKTDAPRPVAQSTAMAAGAMVASGASLAAVAVGYAGLGGPYGGLVATAGGLLAVVLIQDSWRFGLFSARRVWSAAANDAAVCCVTLAGLWLLSRHDALGPLTILGAWAAGSAVGALLGIVQMRAWPRPDLAINWYQEQRRLGLPLLGSVIAQQSMGRLSLIVVSAFGGAGQLGLIVAARTVLSPVNTLIAATYAFAVPDAVRRWEVSPKALTRYTSMLGSSLAGLAILLTFFLLAMPDEWGRVIAGENWARARALLLPTCLWIVGVGLSQGARVGLRVLERTDAVFRVSVGLGIWMLTCTTAGVWLNGGIGAAWGFGVASLSGQLVWSRAYRRALAAASQSDNRR